MASQSQAQWDVVRERRRKKPQTGWAWSNGGTVLGFEYTRKCAVAAAENHAGQPWNECRLYMEVWRCVVKAAS